MSATVLVRAAAARASIRTAAQAAPRRQFSLATGLRNLTKGFEPHPHARHSISQTHQPGDYPKYFKKAAKTGLIFVPLSISILGWPAAARLMLDGNM